MARASSSTTGPREAVQHVETTVPDEKTAARIAALVLEERLAACANWWTIRSRYWWQGKLATDDEALLVLKTTLGRSAELQRRLHELHPYETPYIAAVPLSQVTPAYARWTASEVRVTRT